VISLAQYATAYTRSWAADSTNGRIRIKAKYDRAQQEILLLREEIRIKDARMALISPHRRPYYPPTERMAILELRAARGWSRQQTADVFLVTAATIASWMKRVDEEGPDALVQLREPVNIPERASGVKGLLAAFFGLLGGLVAYAPRQGPEGPFLGGSDWVEESVLGFDCHGHVLRGCSRRSFRVRRHPHPSLRESACLKRQSIRPTGT